MLSARGQWLTVTPTGGPIVSTDTQSTRRRACKISFAAVPPLLLLSLSLSAWSCGSSPLVSTRFGVGHCSLRESIAGLSQGPGGVQVCRIFDHFRRRLQYPSFADTRRELRQDGGVQLRTAPSMIMHAPRALSTDTVYRYRSYRLTAGVVPVDRFS